jgi:ACS family tartrate transporter-like MFS transporter
MWRLIPFLFVLYVVAYLDRINVSFAALTMNKALGLSDAVYGWGSGIFFVGYFLFEVPSNLIMHRTGARRWIARIMMSWGLLSMAMMFTGRFFSNVADFFMLRFLLGVAEAGFFPGMILYLTYWFPRAQRARAVAWFMTATSVSGVVGSPLSGALLAMDGMGGLAGWQWLFLLEGLPAVFLGVAVLFYLTDRPEEATWLDDDERDWLVAHTRTDEAERAAQHGTSLASALKTPAVWLFALLYFTLVIGFYGVGFWMPKIIKASGELSDFAVGWWAAVPNLVSVFAMIAVGTSSDRTGERHWHVAISALVGASGLVLTTLCLHSTVLVVASLSLALAGLRSTLGPFWAMPTSVLAGTAAAGGIAFINSVGNLGGGVGPTVYGELRDRLDSHVPGLWFLAGSLCVAAVVCLLIRGGSRRAA